MTAAQPPQSSGIDTTGIIGFGLSGLLSAVLSVAPGLPWIARPALLGAAGYQFAIAAGLHFRRDPKTGDYIGGFQAIQDAPSALVDEREILEFTNQVIEFGVLPPAIKTAAEVFVEEVQQSTHDWIDALDSRSHIIAGYSGGGKTYYTGMEIARFYDRHPNGILRICDTDYGKRDWYWMGLPLRTPEQPNGIVLRKVDEIIAAILDASQEVERRAELQAQSPHKFQPYKLVVDEFAQLKKEIELNYPDQAKAINKAVFNLLVRGHGYRVFVTLMGQNASVGMLGIDEAQKDQCGVLVIKPNGEDEFKDIARGDEAKEFKRQMARLEGMGMRPAIVQSDSPRGRIRKVVAIPEVPMGKLPDLAYRASDPVAAWVEANRSIINQMQSEGASVTKIWDALDKPQKRQDESNPYYVAIKELIA